MLLSSRWTWAARAYELLALTPLVLLVTAVTSHSLIGAILLGALILGGGTILLSIMHSDIKTVALDNDYLRVGFWGRFETVPLIQARLVGLTSAYYGFRSPLPMIEVEYVDQTGQRRGIFFLPRSELSQQLLAQALERSVRVASA